MSLPTVAVTCAASDQGGPAVAFGVYTAKLDQTEISNGFVVPESITVTADANGIAVMNLWPNALGVAGSMYRITARNPDTGKKFLDANVVVPNAACNLHQILVQEPYPAIDAAQQALIDTQAALADAQAQAVLADDDRVAAEIAAAQALTRSAAAALSQLNAGLAEIEVEADRVAVQATATQFGDVAGAVSAATTQAGIATTGAGTATTQAGLAAAARVLAEAARDSINTTGKVFTAAEGAVAGIAATTNGQQFAVLAADLLSYGIWRNNAGVALALSSSYTKAYVDLLADLTADRYYQGKRVMFSRADASQRGGDVITDDGYHYAKYTLRGLNGVAVSVAPDGFFELSLGGSVDSMAFAGGNTLGGVTDFYYDGKKVVRGWGDLSNRGSIVEADDGTVYIPKLSSPVLSTLGISAPLESSTHVFDVASVSGKNQIFRTSKTSGLRVQATSIGDNTAPRLSFDGSKVIYSTNRNGARAGYYQVLSGAKFGGSIEHSVLPLAGSLAALGDSMTAAGYADTVAASLGVALAAPTSGPMGGIGSQLSTQIAARYAATLITCTVTGNQVAAGANVLTAISIPLLSRTADTVGTVRSLQAIISGINGLLTSTHYATAVAGSIRYGTTGADYYVYTFTPDGGQTLPVAAAAGGVLVIDPQARQDYPLLAWIGRNDVGVAGWQDTVKANLVAIIAAYKPLVRKIGILSICNGSSEPTGSANHTAITAFNAEISALYPDHYIDVRTTFVAGNADDTPLPAYLADGLHYNTAGKLVIAAAVTAFITSKGWY